MPSSYLILKCPPGALTGLSLDPTGPRWKEQDNRERVKTSARIFPGSSPLPDNIRPGVWGRFGKCVAPIPHSLAGISPAPLLGIAPCNPSEPWEFGGGVGVAGQWPSISSSFLSNLGFSCSVHSSASPLDPKHIPQLERASSKTQPNEEFQLKREIHTQ